MRLVKLLFTLFFVLGSILFVVLQIIAFKLGISSRKQRYDRDLKFLRNQIKDYIVGLIPLDKTELELLSIKPIIKTSRRGISKVTKGYLSSIYQEPLFAFAYKKVKLSDESLLLVQSKEDEFLFILNGQDAQVIKNGKNFGKINDRGELFDTSDKTVLARINDTADEIYKTIQKNGRELAHVRKWREDDNQTSRAIPILEPMDSNEVSSVVPLVLYDLLIKPQLK